MLVFLDMAFFVFHTALMLFNMVGWAWRRSRPYHLICLLLTAASWFILGAFYGWGYCICTDWHFQVREKLGYPDVGPSYLQLLAVEFFGIRISQSFADGLASFVFALIVIATAASWWRQLRHRITPGPASSA
jgi:Protein of Unknown function (DUF2784)